jgi:hypothetical protein
MIQEPPATGLVPFLKGWGSLIVAAVALVQPWVYALWKRLFRPGDIDIYPSTRIEIGYSGLGPTIGLTGTLRAVHKDQFVESLQLVVTKLKDSSRHDFDWVVLRAGKLLSTGTSEVSMELVSGFMLMTNQPYRYNILFQDGQTQTELGKYMDDVRVEWAKVQKPAGSVLEDVFRAFGNQSTTLTDNYTAIDRQMYWEPGSYRLEIIVNTTRPEQSISEEWVFELTSADVKGLRLNPLIILREVCGLTVTYNFAYPAYQETLEPEPE